MLNHPNPNNTSRYFNQPVENYLNNPLLKKAGQTIYYEPWQLIEIQKCMNPKTGYSYFIENYLKVIDVDKGIVPFILRKYQKKLLKAIHNNRRVVAKQPRQSGKSICLVAYFIWSMIFKDYYRIAMVANKEDTTKELLSRFQLAYEHLPLWLQMGIVTYNKKSVELENGSKIVAGSTSSSSIRGQTYNFLYIDEHAHIHESVSENFFRSVFPTIASGKTTKVVITSTPSGFNSFFKTWNDAIKKKNKYIPIEVDWKEVPHYTEKFKREQIEEFGQQYWDQEYSCEFLGSQNTLISSQKLKTLSHSEPIEDDGNGFLVYEQPDEFRNYIITCDVSEGVGMDYSAFNIIDVTEYPFKQVATYRNNLISSLLYPGIIHSAATKYNEALVLIEVNDIGHTVAHDLYRDFEYENIIFTKTQGRAGQKISGGFGSNVNYGVKMTKQVKRIGCSNLKTLIENDKLLLQDFNTIAELYSFIREGETFQADDTMNDDLTMSLVSFAWLSNQQYFKDLTNSDLRKKIIEERRQAKDIDFVPFGFLNDGVDEAEINEETNRFLQQNGFSDDFFM